jgi:hypothetical protein
MTDTGRYKQHQHPVLFSNSSSQPPIDEGTEALVELFPTSLTFKRQVAQTGADRGRTPVISVNASCAGLTTPRPHQGVCTNITMVQVSRA